MYFTLRYLTGPVAHGFDASAMVLPAELRPPREGGRRDARALAAEPRGAVPARTPEA